MISVSELLDDYKKHSLTGKTKMLTSGCTSFITVVFGNLGILLKKNSILG
jgi:hypothetical protein